MNMRKTPFIYLFFFHIFHFLGRCRLFQASESFLSEATIMELRPRVFRIEGKIAVVV